MYRTIAFLLFILSGLTTGAEAKARRAKNVILLLADAGGIATVNAASLVAYNAPQKLFVQSWPNVALSDTSPHGGWVTDSAAGMTAIVTGQKTWNGVISQGPDAVRGKQDGTVLKTILEYAEEHGLSEETIGLLLGSNGLLIFLTEMPLVRYCETRHFGLHAILRASVLLIAASFAVLNLLPQVAFLWVGMLFMTVGEMLCFPFTNRMANERADRGRPGAYMGLYTIAWSVAHIIGHSLGLNLIAWTDFATTWWIFTGVLLVCAGLLVLLERMMRAEGARQ